MMTEPGRLASFIKAIASADAAADRQELVINGDFVDFLAETHGHDDTGQPQWEPFIEDPTVAAECFSKIASGMDAPVFDALGELLEAGHRLTILPGNHDIELCLPAVRQALLNRLRCRVGHDIHVGYDGEAYTIGDAIIEHGNRYDDSNFIDHERLHNLRVKQSLRQDCPTDLPFAPPLGSFFVARAMNRIKKQYSFVDLLKPEGPALVGLLLAIDPELREEIGDLTSLVHEHHRRHSKSNLQWKTKTVFRGQAQDQAWAPESTNGDLAWLLRETLGEDVLVEVLTDRRSSNSLRGTSQTRGAVRDSWALLTAGGWEVIRLLIGGRRLEECRRVDLLRKAVQKMGASPAFDRHAEVPGSAYLAAARQLARSEEHPDGFRFVIFGHTHHAKDIPLGDGARYLNSGTWANLMSFPAALFDATTEDKQAEQVLTEFLGDLKRGMLKPHIRFEPTCVRLLLDENGNVRESTVEDAAC